MATTPSAIQGLPAGAVLTPITSAPQTADIDTSQIQGLPAGATLTPIAGASPTPPEPSSLVKAANVIGEVGGQVETGFEKGAGETVSGISHLIHKIPVVGETLAPAVGMSALDKMDVAQGTAEAAGKGLEGIAEFAAGDELLEGLSKGAKLVALAKKYPLINEMMIMAKDHPLLAKIISEGGKAATVGGIQGAVKGAPQGKTAAGAVGGAIGGGVGGAVGGAVSGVATRLVNPYRNLQQAVRPMGNAAREFAEKAELAIPRLRAENAITPVKTLEGLSDAAHNAANKLWTQEIVPQITRHAGALLDGKPVANAIRAGVLPGDADLFPEAYQAAEEFAKKFESPMHLDEASDRLQSLNRKLQGLYKLDPASRYAATANSPAIEAMESGANELRQQIYKKLTALGETDPAGLRQTYGGLKTVQQAAEKRALVYNRQNPINLSQIWAHGAGALEMATAIASGHPLAAVAGFAPIAVAQIAKRLNAPEHLIQSALEESGLIPKLAGVATKGLAAGGAQAGQAVATPSGEPQP